MPLPQITNSRAIERQAIAELLRKCEPGNTVTYGDMKAAIGSDARKVRHVIEAARKEVRDDDGKVFQAISNVGMRCMTESEIAMFIPGFRRRKAHRQASIGLKEIATIKDPTKLPAGERLQYAAGASLLGAIAAVSTHRAMDRVQGEIKTGSEKLPVEQTLSALSHIK